MKKWLFLFTILLIASCSQKIVSYINTDANFQDFNTFRIVSSKLEGRKVEPENPNIFNEIRSEIVNQMTVRSYELSNITPDLTLRYELSSSSRTSQINNNNSNSPFGNPAFPISTKTIHESIILIELFDTNKELVWQGSYDLKNEKREVRASKVIKNALDQIFTTYPYKAGSKEVHKELMSTNKKKND